MKAIKLVCLPIIAMIAVAIVANVVLIMTSSVTLALTVGWMFGLPMIVGTRLLRYVSFDYSGADKYPRPWATAGNAILSLSYSHSPINTGRYNICVK